VNVQDSSCAAIDRTWGGKPVDPLTHGIDENRCEPIDQPRGRCQRVRKESHQTVAYHISNLAPPRMSILPIRYSTEPDTSTVGG